MNVTKKIALALAALVLAGTVCCGEKILNSAPPEGPAAEQESAAESASPDEVGDSDEPTTEAPTEHVSPRETVSATIGSQQVIDKTIQRTQGSNTIQLPLSDFIEEGDVISSFTFVIYSGDGANIGDFKGGCGISVLGDCPAATDEGWYQSPDFTAATQGTYGEIRWDVPADVRDYVTAAGDVLFGYWWGNSASVRLDSVICTFQRSREIPVDGTVSQNVGKSVSFSDTDNTIKVPAADFLPEGAVPQLVTFNVSSSGPFGKYTGAFGYTSPSGYYQSGDTAVFTDSSSLSLSWFVPGEAQDLIDKDGELMLGYWWSEQPTVTLDSVTVKYSLGGGGASTVPAKPADSSPAKPGATGFRSSAEIVGDIKVGWNLGNSLDSYGTGKSGIYTEIGWGNLKTTEDMIKAVKNAGFNAIRIPVTWGEHADGNNITAEWLDRVQEVVDYAYNNGMYVILNMHHDDYIWFTPNDSQYADDSARLKAFWSQIADRFKDYGDTLLFEGMNEPRTVGSSAEWMGGTAAERAVINKYEQDFVDTVRASGGNNAERTLVVTSYAASAEDVAMNDLAVPNDSHVIVSLHYYAPWKLADGQTTSFGDAEKNELSAKFRKMKEKFIDKGVPLIIGEFGCVAVADDSTRSQYYSYYISAAKAQGIKCFIWDNGLARGEGAYGLFNRGTREWNQTILSGIMQGAD